MTPPPSPPASEPQEPDMTATTTTAAPTSGRSEAQEIHFKSERGAKIRMYAGLSVLIVWGLAPFYWMVATSFRPVGNTFETTLWPTPSTLENYKTAFSTD